MIRVRFICMGRKSVEWSEAAPHTGGRWFRHFSGIPPGRREGRCMEQETEKWTKREGFLNLADRRRGLGEGRGRMRAPASSFHKVRGDEERRAEGAVIC